MSKRFLKAKKRLYKRAGKKADIIRYEISLSAQAKKKIPYECNGEQKFIGIHAETIRPNRKGKTSLWKRGGEFPTNRPRAGESGRARWTKGNNFQSLEDSPFTVKSGRTYDDRGRN